jgi:hypothetical protein
MCLSDLSTLLDDTGATELVPGLEDGVSYTFECLLRSFSSTVGLDREGG